MSKKLFLSMLLALILCMPVQAVTDFQTHTSIYTAVNEYAQQHINSDLDLEISITPLDKLLKLPLCAEALETFSPSELLKAGRTSIGVRCNSPNAWSIYVSAVIKIYQQVLILTQPLQRGEFISQRHVMLERRDVSGLRGDFVSNLEQIDNKQAVRSLTQGSILSPRSLVEPQLIKRNDKVIISAEQSSFSIKMNGIAMRNGSKGELIPIKNQNSGRIINATVIAPGLVSVTTIVVK
jgi:flagellar basal body P-ring formation protein FlgA